ncbi:hypothetical protein GCM10027446_05190 [Angustibacter peucedani]
MSSLVLRPLRVDDEAAARRAHEELLADHFEFLLDTREGEPWADYVARLDRVSRGEDVREGWVPASFLVADVDGEVVGRISVRHGLNDWLAEHGGHIGYGVRPGSRRRGYASEMLRQALDVARSVGLTRVMVTCEPSNTGSAAVIERCGGVFERLSQASDEQVAMRRCWIDLEKDAPVTP